MQVQLAVRDHEMRQAAQAGADQALAQRRQGLIGDGEAHRSMVPVRRIFFCSCSTP